MVSVCGLRSVVYSRWGSCGVVCAVWCVVWYVLWHMVCDECGMVGCGEWGVVLGE